MAERKSVRWDGIRGPLARKNLTSIVAGDLVYGYHATPEKALVCEARVTRAAYPDPADEKWLAVDVSFERWLPRPVLLNELRTTPSLAHMDFLRIPRLSVAPLTPAEDCALRVLFKKEKSPC